MKREDIDKLEEQWTGKECAFECCRLAKQAIAELRANAEPEPLEIKPGMVFRYSDAPYTVMEPQRVVALEKEGNGGSWQMARFSFNVFWHVSIWSEKEIREKLTHLPNAKVKIVEE